MEEFLKKYNERVDFYTKHSNGQVNFNDQRYIVCKSQRQTTLMLRRIKENISLKELVSHINKVLLLSSKVYNNHGIVMNIFDIIPVILLESLINDYPSFNTYVQFYILNEIENKKFFEKVVQFENEKSIYLSLDYIDISIDFNIYKDLVVKISKFENTKLINKTFSKKNTAYVIKRVLKNLKTKEIDDFFNCCSKNFIESISQNLYFINILPKNLIKEYIHEPIDQKNDENRKNTVSVCDDESVLLVNEIRNPTIISNSNNDIPKNINETYKITFDETKIMIQNIFDEKFKTFLESFIDVKELLNFLKTYTFLKIDKGSIDHSIIEDYIELFKYIDSE